ncbi:MAG: hypothetical protein ACLS29_00925 [Prevotellamassilia sp.]
MPEQGELTWEEFVESYESTFRSEDEADEVNMDELLLLEQLVQHPMQLNRLTREDLLLLPFLAEQQVDSILDYRKRKYGFRSMGELQLVSGLDFFARQALSLFVRCDSAWVLPPRSYGKQAPIALKEHFKRASHEWETRIDLPLYRRQGDRIPDKPTPTNYYTGAPFRHLLRYRYHYKRALVYGVTLETDPGEPLARRGFYPYDYLSAYAYFRPVGHNWAWVVGDYELQHGEGLVFGKQFFANREGSYHSGRRADFRFRPHTGTDESRFFRGGAGAYQWKKLHLAAFVSYQKKDARLSETRPVVETLYQSGLHRTQSEISHRRTLGELCVGGSGAGRKSIGDLKPLVPLPPLSILFTLSSIATIVRIFVENMRVMSQWHITSSGGVQIGKVKSPPTTWDVLPHYSLFPYAFLPLCNWELNCGISVPIISVFMVMLCNKGAALATNKAFVL